MKCKLCNGDGIKVVPIKNLARIQITVHNYKGEVVLVTPDYLTSITDCDCVKENNGS